MNNTIVICGYGPGISRSMARRFGRAGHRVALVARNGERLAAGVAALEAEGLAVRAFVADLGDVRSVRDMIAEVSATYGPIGILHWNAFHAVEGDLLSLADEDLSKSFDVRIRGFLAAVQASLPDLEECGGAVLATGGAMCFDAPEVNAFAADFGALAITVAAQHKAVSLLAHSLAPRGVFVGEVIVTGFVKGTQGSFGREAPIDPDEVAAAFADLLSRRSATSLVLRQTTASSS